MKTEMLCPNCFSSLHSKTDTDGHYFLLCSGGCADKWPIENGVVSLVPDDIASMVKDTVDSFAFKWSFDPKAAYEERQRIATYWFYDRFGFLPEGEAALGRTLVTKKRILDAGCGLGNLLSTFSRLAPHASVWGVDLSTAIYEAAKIHGSISLRNVTLVRGDITRLPIDGEFDFIASDGVLHHTANTRESFLALAKKLAPGGDMLVYVYRKKAPIREFADDYLRMHTTRMSPEECIEFSRQMMDLGRQLREAHITLKFDKPIPLLGIREGEIDLQRFVYWYVMKAFYDDGKNETASILENLDWYHPKLAHRHEPDEVRAWHKEAGLEIVRLDVGDSGISSWARRH